MARPAQAHSCVSLRQIRMNGLALRVKFCSHCNGDGGQAMEATKTARWVATMFVSGVLPHANKPLAACCIALAPPSFSPTTRAWSNPP